MYAVVSFREALLLAGLNSMSKGTSTALLHSSGEIIPSIVTCVDPVFWGSKVSCATPVWTAKRRKQMKFNRIQKGNNCLANVQDFVVAINCKRTIVLE